MISTLIFDLDGLLADTEKLHRRAYQEVLGEMGFALPDQQYDEHWIRDGKGICEYVAEHYLTIDPNEIRLKKAERYEELVLSSAEAMPGAMSALESLRDHKAIALATSSHGNAAQAVLHTLGIQGFFDHIATKESANRIEHDFELAVPLRSVANSKRYLRYDHRHQPHQACGS